MNKNITIVLAIILVLVLGLVVFSDSKPVTENESETSESNLNLTAGPIVGSVKSETLGEYLTDTTGKTLYVFSDDKKLESVCKDDCLNKWPPFVAEKDPATFTDKLTKRMNIIKRSDGSIQYAYGEKPVYYFAEDMAPGDTKGNGLGNGKWSIVLITE